MIDKPATDDALERYKKSLEQANGYELGPALEAYHQAPSATTFFALISIYEQIQARKQAAPEL